MSHLRHRTILKNKKKLCPICATVHFFHYFVRMLLISSMLAFTVIDDYKDPIYYVYSGTK